ncbi:MAG: hypothetical protein ABIG64_04905, partial [Candidatus Omnitrophota bacterium]
MSNLRQRIPLKSLWKTSFICLMALSVLILGTTIDVYARTKVQSGYSASLSTNSYTVTIEAVDLDKAIILFSVRTVDNTDDPDGLQWCARFNSATQIEFQRSGGSTSDDMMISWYVVEADAFQVEPFQVSIAANEVSRTITLNNQTPSTASVDFVAAKSFVVLSAGNYGSTNANYLNACYFTGQLSYDTGGGGADQVILTRNYQEGSTTTAEAIDVWGFVVLMRDDSTIYQGSSYMDEEGYFITATIKNTLNQTVAVDRSKSFMIFGLHNDVTALQSEIRGSISSDTQVGFNRRGTGTGTGNSWQYWYVIELGTLGRMQSGALNIPKGYLYEDHVLAYPVDTDYAFSISSQDSTGTGTANYRTRHTTQFIASGANVRFERGESGQHAICDFFITELEPMILFTPNGGELWRAGETEDITWYAPDSLTNVELLLSTNSGSTFTITIAASTPNDGIYEWTIPSVAGIIGNQMRVKVRDVNWNELSRTNDEYSCDVSDADFEIICKLVITYPNGGESIPYEAATNLTWNFYGDGTGRTVALKYSSDGGGSYTNTIATGLSASAGTHTLNWTTTPIPLGSLNRIKIEQETEESRVNDTSDANFSVTGALTITYPNGAETFNIGESENIAWTANGGAFMTSGVNLQLSRNSGGSYGGVIANGIAADSSPYPWTVEAPGSTECLVKVISVDFPLINDVSDALFTILEVIHLDIPSDTGIIWRVATTHNIEWTTYGTVSTIDLHYSTNGADWNLITDPAGIANVSPYSWIIPDDISNTVKVRIRDHSNTVIADESNNNFSIKGSISVVEPHLNEIINLGDNKNIQWDLSGSVTGTANIRLSKNGGTTYDTLINSVDITAESYNWTPTSTHMGTNNKIKVGLTGDEDPSTGTAGESDAFAVEADLAMVYPNVSGLTFGIGNEIYIKWTPNPAAFGMVNLRYSTDGGTTYNGFIADGVASNDIPSGESEIGYKWTIPDVAGMVSTNCRIKVYQVGKEASVYAFSQYTFTVKGSINLTAPDGGETWLVDEFESITWTKGGDIGTVKLEYSVDGGSDGYPNLIAAGVAGNALSYPWQISNAIGTQLKVKITQESDTTTYDTSTAVFTIKGRFSLSAPIGGETWFVGNQQNISWTTYGTISKVNLYYSTDGGSTFGSTIITNLTNAAGYLWTIPDVIDTDIRVKVESFFDSSVSAESVGNFTIKGQITVSAPNGPEEWRVGATENITWVVKGSIGNVEIRYSTNSGASYDNVIVASTPALNQTYAWTNIPDIIGTNLKIKITSISDNTVVDESDVDFKIKGVLTLTAPNGNETWIVGESEDITWTKQGTLGNVELRYSTDRGVTYPAGNTIATGIAATATPYSWTIPDEIGSDLRVRVALLTDPTIVVDDSNNDFEIKGKLEIVTPNGAEAWGVGTSQAITWDTTGSISMVKLEYSIDGGNTFPNTIIDSTSAVAESYNWTIPNAIGTQLRVKISNTADAAVNDTSDANFIIKGRLIITHPNGAETLTVGQSYTADWNTFGSISKVNLYYSTNGGSSYDATIILDLNNTNSYAWTVPDAIGTQLRVKIENDDDTTVSDTSDGDFTIKGSLTVISPNGGQTWIVDNVQNITWSKQGTLGTIQLDYSINGGSSYDYSIDTAVNSADLSYAWTIPDSISNNVKVKLTSESDSSVYDESNAVFEIKGSITVTSPNGGESWPIGSSQDVTWTKHGSIGNIEILYSIDGVPTYSLTLIGSTDSSTGSYTCAVIPDTPSTTAKVKIASLADSTVYDESNSNFRIRATVTLTAPDGAEEWVVGTSENITWTKTGSITTVALEYSTNSGSTYPNSITTASGEALSQSWTIPDAIGSTLRVRIRNTADATVSDTSDANFIIKGSVTAVTPNGGEVFIVDSTYDLEWSYVGSIPNVKLEYSEDGGSTYPVENLIIASTPAVTLAYSWTVPDSITDQFVIRVSDALDSSVSDVSNAFAKIKGSLTITAPNGAENWVINDSHNITWTRTGSIANVKLEYSTDDGATYPNLIVTGIASNLLIYNWTIPDDPSALAKVKITSLVDTTVNDSSNASFRIKGSVDLTAPNGGQTWIVGSTQQITWTKFGNLNLLTLAYSTNGGATFDNTINSSVSASALTYNWLIPDAIGTQLRVKITSNDDATVTDQSTADFEIKGSVTLTAPNGSEIWFVGESRNITWTHQGSIGNVGLTYSTDAGSTYPNTITTGVPATNLTYAWTVPDKIGNQLKIKITSVNDSAVLDESNNNFTIKGILALTSPNGTEIWIVGESRNITWNITGSIANVKLEYSTDGGTSYANEIIASTDAAAGSYSWTVPNAIDTDIRVRVSDVTDSSVNDTSSANFEIKGSLALTAPNGGEAWIVASSQNITWTKTGTIANVE